MLISWVRTQQVATEGKERWLGTELGDRRGFPGHQCHTFRGGRSLAVDRAGPWGLKLVLWVSLIPWSLLSASPYYLPWALPVPLAACSKVCLIYTWAWRWPGFCLLNSRCQLAKAPAETRWGYFIRLLLLNLQGEATCDGSGPSVLSEGWFMPWEIKGHVSIPLDSGVPCSNKWLQPLACLGALARLPLSVLAKPMRD